MPSFKTVDDETFVAGGEPPTNVRQLIWQGLPGVYIAAAAGGLYKTVDYGATWGVMRPNTEFATLWPGGASGYQVSMAIGPRECPPESSEACAVRPLTLAAFNNVGGAHDPFDGFNSFDLENNVTGIQSVVDAFNPTSDETSFIAYGVSYSYAGVSSAISNLNFNGDDVQKWAIISVASRKAVGTPDIPSLSGIGYSDIEVVESIPFGSRSRFSVFKAKFSDPSGGEDLLIDVGETQEAITVMMHVLLTTPIDIDPIAAAISNTGTVSATTFLIPIDYPSSLSSLDHTWVVDNFDDGAGEGEEAGAAAIGLLLSVDCGASYVISMVGGLPGGSGGISFNSIEGVSPYFQQELNAAVSSVPTMYSSYKKRGQVWNSGSGIFAFDSNNNAAASNNIVLSGNVINENDVIVLAVIYESGSLPSISDDAGISDANGWVFFEAAINSTLLMGMFVARASVAAVSSINITITQIGTLPMTAMALFIENTQELPEQLTTAQVKARGRAVLIGTGAPNQQVEIGVGSLPPLNEDWTPYIHTWIINGYTEAVGIGLAIL